MSMKDLLAFLTLGLASMPVAGCVLTTDFSEPTGSGTGGETIWTVEDPGLPEGRSVVALPDGGFVVGVGTATNPSVLRFDADGQQVWAQTAAFEDRDFGGLTLSPAGDVLVVGTIPIDEELAIGELWVGGLSVEDGSEQWFTPSGIPLESTSGQAIAVGPDGGLRVAGFSGNSVALMAGLGSDGALQWWEEATELGQFIAQGTDVLVLPDGSAVFVGTSGDGGPGGFWARRIDAMGAELWTWSFGGELNLAGTWSSIERRDDGTLVIVGTSYGTGYETMVVELGEDGAQQQIHIWEWAGLGQRIFGTALASDRTLYLAGDVGPDGGRYGALDEHGDHLWSHVFAEGEPLHGTARDAAILSDGSVVLVGSVGSDEISDEIPHLWMRKTEP